MTKGPKETPGTIRDDQKGEIAALGGPSSGLNPSDAGIEIADADIQAGLAGTRDGIAASASGRITLDLKRSDLYISLLETIRLAQRPKIIKRADRGKESNELYGNFSYNISFDDNKNFKTVSIIEAIAWFKHKGELSPDEATFLTNLCIDAMKRTPHRLESFEDGHKAKLKRFSDQERAIEINELTEAAALIAGREIERPDIILSLQTQLRNASITGDFRLYVEGSERPFLEGIFHHREAERLDTGTALELALMCINAMIRYKIPASLIASQVSFTYSLRLINEPELNELIGAIIADPDEAAIEIKVIIAMESADEPPAPPLMHRAIGPEHDYIFAPNPDIARARGSSRLALLVAGILLVGGGTAIYTSRLSRENDLDHRTTAAASVASTPLSPVTGGSPSVTDPATHASEGEARGKAKSQEPKSEAAASAPRTDIPRPNRASSPSTRAATPTPTPTPIELIPLQRLAPKAPAEIVIPIVVKSGKEGFKIDPHASRAKWEALGYEVSVSMGLKGKTIMLRDSKGHIYQVVTAGLTLGSNTSTAILQGAKAPTVN